MERYSAFLAPFDPDMARIEEARLVYGEILHALQSDGFKPLNEANMRLLQAFNLHSVYDLAECRLYRSKLQPSLRILITPEDLSAEHAAVFFPLNRVEQVIAINIDALIFDVFNHEYQHWKNFLAHRGELKAMRPIDEDGIDIDFANREVYANDQDELNSYFLEEAGSAYDDVRFGRFREYKHLSKIDISKRVVNDILTQSAYYENVFSHFTPANRKRFMKRTARFVDRYLVPMIKEYV